MVWQNERLEFCLLALADQVLSRGSIPDPRTPSFRESILTFPYAKYGKVRNS